MSVFVSRDVIFCENENPFKSEKAEDVINEEDVWLPLTSLFEEEENQRRLGRIVISNPMTPQLIIGPLQSPVINNSSNFRDPPSSVVGEHSRQIPETVTPPSLQEIAPVPQSIDSGAEPVQVEERLGRGQRQRTQSVKLKFFVVNTTSKRTEKSQASTSTHSIANYVDCERFSPQHQAYLAAITSGVEPKSFKQAMEDERWNKAMASEIDAQQRNKSWTIEDLPKGKKAIGCKWVYKLKYRSDGTLERHKARLVALGNKQIEGEDYGETFAPVAKMGTVRLFWTLR